MNKEYNLLIVDDEDIEREAIKYVLQRSDIDVFQFFEAQNGQEAISEAALHKPDIILMDIQMPGLNGIEATKIIKKILPECRVIFLTAYDQFDYAHEGIKLGVEEFIIKPVSNERFLSVMKTSIDKIKMDVINKKKAEAIESKLDQVSEYLEREFVSAVISGDLEEKQVKDYLDFFEIPFKQAFGIVINIYSDSEKSNSEIRNQMIKKRYLAKLEEVTTNLPGRIFNTISNNFIYLLVFGESRELLLQLQNKIRHGVNLTSDYFAEEFEVYTDFFIGDVCDELTQMWKSYSKGRAGADKKINKQSLINRERLTSFIKAIQNSDEEYIEKWIEGYVHQLDLHEKTMDTIRIRLYEQSILIINALNEKGLRIVDNSQDIFYQIMSLSTEYDVRQFMKNITRNALILVEEDKRDKTSVVMNKLITYINSHYNENISLEQLSDMCGLSTTYLSKVFKKHVKMNFSDYLAYVRIMVAKRLLKDPSKSMKEISYEIGYTDANYFTRVFKKTEDMTPTEYRNRVLGEEV